MDWKYSKTSRTLDMYDRLCHGQIIVKATDALHYGVDERSIQRDIDELRSFLENRAIENPGDQRQIVYDRQKKGFVLSGHESGLMSNSEILAVSKILLASRAFSKKEMTELLRKLVSGCIPRENMKLVTDLLSNEAFHYVQLQNPTGITEKLWELGQEINNQRLMQIEYQRQGTDVTRRIVQPVAILFSEFYFYLIAYLTEEDGAGEYIRKYDYPAIYRIDRIKSYNVLEKRFSLP